ncbi:MAG: flagellar hook-length control protein FliK [Lachnospiraceae bacterium]|nr:flagellar hook-length control protein FliK [Lachnospiraceae bacterium]
MKLSSFFSQTNQVQTQNVTQDTSAMEQNIRNGMQQITGKMPGETINGTIVDKNGNEILISIGKNQLLQAKLEGGAQIDIGQQLTFAIKSAMGSKVTLSPLFTNMATDPNISKALQMAGIPETETSVAVVKSMMQEGMSIDKNSLQQMMRTVNLNPQANLDTILGLVKLQIPVTEESIFQFEAYKNYEHQISDGIMNVADTLPKSLQNLSAQGNLAEGIALYKEVISMLGEQNLTAGGDGAAQATPTANVFSDITLNLSESGAQNPQVVGNEAGGALTANLGENELSQLGLTKNETENLANSLKQAGFTQLSDAVLNNQATKDTFFSQFGKLLSSQNFLPEAMEHIGKLLEGDELNKLVKQEFKNQFMLSPEDVADGEKVEDLYERLNNNMNRLSQVVEQAASQTPFAKAVTNMAGNIDFMNQLNQMFTYVQIPLKLQGQEANGELYVYTNKRNLAKEDGEVSALLHLDMEHLGSVNVHVSMKEMKVATKFYLEDDKALDLIADNIHILNERLEKRGYQMNASFIHQEKEQNVIDEILEQDKNVSVLAGYSFDARA